MFLICAASCVVVANYLFSCAAAKSAAQLNLHTDLAEKWLTEKGEERREVSHPNGFLVWFMMWLHKQLYKHKEGSGGNKWVRSGRKEAI